jgi:hypothetical protein
MFCVVLVLCVYVCLFSSLAACDVGLADDGKLEAIGYVAEQGDGVTSKVMNVVNMVGLFSGVLFGDQPVQDEERIFGGR